MVFYMYIGGTNFGFSDGGGGPGWVTTSYDYDAMLSETGDMTWKWQKILEVIKKYRKDIPTWPVQNSTRRAYGTVTFTEGCTIYEGLEFLTSNKVHSDHPMTMEDLDVPYGITIYRKSMSSSGMIHMGLLRDRANVMVDEQRVAIVNGFEADANATIKPGMVDIIVQNLGRQNGGELEKFLKGLHNVTLGGKLIEGWDNIGLDLERINKLPFRKQLQTKVPSYYRGQFTVDQVADTFLNFTSFVQGVAWVNGFNLGKYWNIGPQLTLYVPAGVLHEGVNELVIFEFESQADTVKTMSFEDTHHLGSTVKWVR
jgi:beta-galactosidase